VSVVEVLDCFSPNEMFLLNALGLAPLGEAHEFVRRGDITCGGKYMINPSGGLISKGHPLGKFDVSSIASSSTNLSMYLQEQPDLLSVPSSFGIVEAGPISGSYKIRRLAMLFNRTWDLAVHRLLQSTSALMAKGLL
jgi:hypothetical protein